MARNIKYDHNVVVTGLNDGTKQVSKDAWNDGHDEAGMFGHGIPTTLTIAAGAIIPINSMHIIAGQGASADNLDNITNTETATRDELWLIRGSEVITVRDNSVSGGNIFLLSGSTRLLDVNKPIRLIRSGTNWYEFTTGGDGVFTNITGLGTQSQALVMGSQNISAVNDITMEGRFKLDKGIDVASGSALTLGGDGNVFDITGITTINTITPTNWQNGSVVHLQFDGILTITHNSGGVNDILLGNQTNMTTAVGDVLSLFFNGTDWIEISRSVVGGTADLPVPDTTSIAEGATDATKEVRFEVDGNTTGITGVLATIFTTAKTITFPDATDTLMGKATTDIMINKTLNADGTGNVITNIGSSEVKSELITGQTQVTPQNTDEILITDISDAGNLKRVLISALPTSLPVPDTTSIVEGSADVTKELRLEVDGNTTGVIGVMATAFTTAKTVTLPDATDTLVGKATTDVFTNKSINADGTGNVVTNIGSSEIKSELLTGQAQVTPLGADELLITDASDAGNLKRVLISALPSTSLPVLDTTSIAEGSVDNTKEVRFEVDGNATGVIGVLATAFTTAKIITFPDANDTLVGKDTSDVLTNKDILSITNRVDVGTFEIASEVEGDIIFRNATVWTRLPKGTDNQALIATATTIGYESLTLATHVSGASTDLTDTADIAYLNTANTFIAGNRNTFAHDATNPGISVLPVAGNPTARADGAIWLNVTSQQLFARINGIDVDLGEQASQTPWSQDIDADGFDLLDFSNIEFRDTSGASAASIRSIYATTTEMTFNVRTGDQFGFSVNDIDSLTISVNGLKLNTRLQASKGIDVVSAGIMTLGADGNTFDITGSITINEILATNWQAGSIIHLQFDGAPLITHSSGGINDFILVGAVNFQTATGDMLSLFFNGIDWVEISRSVISGAQSPWASDIDADGFDLKDLSNLEFRTSTGAPAATVQALYADAGGINYNVPALDIHDFLVDGVSEMTISATLIDLQANNLNNFVSLLASTSNVTIDSSTGGWTYDVDTGDSHTWRINDVSEMILNATSLDVTGSDIINIGSLLEQQNTTGSLTQDFFVDTAVLDDTTIAEIRFRAQDGTPTTQNYARILAKMESDIAASEDGSLQFFVTEGGVHDVAYMSFNDGSGADIIVNKPLDMGANIEMGVNILQFVDANQSIQDASGVLQLDVATGNAVAIRINNSVQYQFDATRFDVKTNNINLDNGQHIEWGLTATRRIRNDGVGFQFEVPTGDNFDFTINTVSEMTLQAGLLSLQGNDIRDVNFLSFASTNVSIQEISSDLVYDVDTGQSHDFRIADTVELTLDATNGLVLATRLEQAKGGDVASPVGGIMTLGNNGSVFDITGINTINEILSTNWQAGSIITLQFDGILTVTHNSGGINDILLGNQANMVTAAGDVLTLYFNAVDWVEISRSTVTAQTPWTGDIDADGFDLQDLSNIEFRTTTGAPAGTVPAIYKDANGIRINVPAGGEGRVRLLVNNIIEWDFTDGQLDANQNKITDLLRVEFDAGNTSIGIVTNDIEYDVAAANTHRWRVNNVTEMELTDGELNLQGNNLRLGGVAGGVFFDDNFHNILQSASNMRYNTAGSQNHSFFVDGGLEYTLSATTLDLQNNILQFAAGETIQMETNDMVFDVTVGDTFNFDINGTTELTITETIINAAGSAFQEAGVNISPIGTQELAVPASGMWASTTAGATGLNQLELATNDVDIQTFDFTSTTVDEHVQFVWSPPENWDAGTVRVKFKWSHASGTGNVRWGVQATALSNSGILDSTWGTIQEVTDVNETNNDIIISNFTSAMTIGNTPVKGDYIQWRVLRSGSDVADTFTGTARLHEIVIEYAVDGATTGS